MCDGLSSSLSGRSIRPSSGGAFHQREVGLLHRAAGEGAGEKARHLAAARDHENARRLAIDSVGDLHLLVGIALAQERRQRVAPELGGGVHRQTGRLVDDQDARVLVEDLEVPRHLGLDRRRAPQEDRLAGAHRRRRPHRPPVGEEDLLPKDRLDARARQPADPPLQKVIEPPAAALDRHDDVELDDVRIAGCSGGDLHEGNLHEG